MSMEQLLKIMGEVRPDVDFTKENRLVDDGIIDSFDIISFVGMIDSQYGIEIGVDDLMPEHFNSAEALYALIVNIQNKQS